MSEIKKYSFSVQQSARGKLYLKDCGCTANSKEECLKEGKDVIEEALKIINDINALSEEGSTQSPPPKV